ncbi:MAG: hypothetical protein A2622_08365 [Bdellovibrionales bacterium RIFCSPHIGHO2_01_FULL_40_29]|nr:MAG: hypothetical protein A2622_08365 [Bdellovibrionales bacterium RIFCSPHIGHO2_01_FULL_40_29]OFZ35507.1 MAG: hypothetical protein A3D17_07600 [Bdellovibrionales bacterium RIFCSPHIGHO2_02_FULL_40_15]
MKAVRKEIFIKEKLKKEDPVELPMDDLFFDQLHDKIMSAVEKTEMRSQTKWSKARVFLERRLVTSIGVGFWG